MPKPLIGVSCGAHRRNENEIVYGVLPAYTRSIAEAGGIPVLIAPNLGQTVLRELYERVDGILLTGGGDVDASYYGMSNNEHVLNIQLDRDETEITLSKWAAAEDKVTLGICRGIQVANVALGGTLYRDICAEYPDYQPDVQHDLWGKFPRGHEAHPVQIDSESQLAHSLGTTTVKVNTMHHQALRDPAPGLKVTAQSPDGLIEGVELPKARFFVGVQWHPEEMSTYSEPMRRLFSAFVNASQR